jgi:hypothetical protein
MDNQTLQKIDKASRLGLRGQPLRACYLGKIFRVDRLRNSYFGRPSQSWITEADFHPSLEVAKESVEEMRAKGSHWLITERPVVVLSFDTFGISVLSLSGWGSLSESGCKSSDGLSAILTLLERRMIFFKHDPVAVECLTVWPCEYKSWVYGGDIGWTRRLHGERRNPMVPIIAPIYFELLKAGWSLAKPRKI